VAGSRKEFYRSNDNIMQIQPLIEGQFFHIYNRGVNGENLFKEKRNYYYFLRQYIHYCSDVLETYAYSLLKNHFHLLAYVKKNVQVRKKSGEGMILLNASKQLSHFFNSYAQSINNAYKRTGPLFESPFERKLIDNNNYLTSVICYCHHNPQLHGFVNQFKEWEFSSYHTILNNDNTFIASQKIINQFGGIAAFEEAHKMALSTKDFEKYKIEYNKDKIYFFSPPPTGLIAPVGVTTDNESYNRL
jgi:putative transposase